MISIDTETTGVDFWHGAEPFFVTTCDEQQRVLYWETDVDPITRKTQWSDADLDEISQAISGADFRVLQNSKFDVKALGTTLPHVSSSWDWSLTGDTLIASHLLASNQKHDLTTLALVYLGINIQPYEDAVKEAAKEARSLARSRFPEWRIARADDPCMPSASNEPWKLDMWLPRAIAKELDYSDDHPWWTVLSDYANADSSVTLPLYQVLMDQINEKGLLEIYNERMKILRPAFLMEQRGITVSGARLQRLSEEYQEESSKAGRVCVSIAASMGHELTLPKSGNNNSLLEFVFGENGLNLPAVKASKKTGNPSLDKTAKETYLDTLPPRSKAYRFLKNLNDKSKRDTALTYMRGYRKFWQSLRGMEDWYVLHPSLNPTGTDTLRWSSSNPNEQNISKKEGFNLRYCFGPAPGREWWSLDYENIELRIPAYESGEEAMIELFERPDDPPYFGSYHLLNASIVYPDLFWPLADQKGAFKDQYKATWYQSCKNGGFAIQYGCQEKKADATFKRAGAFKAIKERMPRVTALNDHWVTFANKTGYVETLPDQSIGAQRGYPIYCSRNNWGGVSPTIPLNYHVQSTAMWCTAKAMVRCQDYLDQYPGYYLIMQVHDELVFDFPAGGKKNLPKIRMIKRLMEKSGEDIGIPLKVSVSYHPNNWSEDLAI